MLPTIKEVIINRTIKEETAIAIEKFFILDDPSRVTKYHLTELYKIRSKETNQSYALKLDMIISAIKNFLNEDNYNLFSVSDIKYTGFFDQGPVISE